MFLGSFPAKIDEKFRLKIPAKFRHDLSETVKNNTYFVTSDDGKKAQIYPIDVWNEFAQKLQQPPRMDPAKLKYQKFTSFYGMQTDMDSQGRILLPQVLREDAQLAGDVTVIARNDYLEVWNTESIRKTLKEEPLTDADRERLAELGF